MEIFIRERAGFQVLRDRNMTIAHANLDDEFNNIEDYINKKIVPQIRALDSKIISGVENMPGAILKNTGNGGTVFARINSNFDIAQGILALNKISIQKACGILSTDKTQTLQLLSSGKANYILSRSRDALQWKKISGVDFADSSISASKIGLNTLTAAHLSAGILGKPLDKASVIGQYILNNTLGANQIATSAFDSNHISTDLMQSRLGQQLTYLNSSILARNVADNSIDFSSMAGSVLKLTSQNIPLNSVILGPYTQLDTQVLAPASIKPYHIQPHSFNPFVNNLYSDGPGKKNKTCLLTRKHLTPALRKRLNLYVPGD